MPDRVFVYGTLLLPEVMEAVTGKSFSFSQATLMNYTRERIRGRIYPGIRKSLHRSVRGVIYHGVDRNSLLLLDVFEAEEYRRVRVTVDESKGKRVNAWTYVIRPRYKKILTHEAWDVEEFGRNHLKLYLQKLGNRKWKMGNGI